MRERTNSVENVVGVLVDCLDQLKLHLSFTEPKLTAI